jgi:hypothetical protein
MIDASSLGNYSRNYSTKRKIPAYRANGEFDFATN